MKMPARRYLDAVNQEQVKIEWDDVTMTLRICDLALTLPMIPAPKVSTTFDHIVRIVVGESIVAWFLANDAREASEAASDLAFKLGIPYLDISPKFYA
jgi:hypothetical protein